MTDDPTSFWAYVHSASAGCVAVSLWETMTTLTGPLAGLVVYSVFAVVMLHAVHLHRKHRR